jgi:predicted phosphodiesterase
MFAKNNVVVSYYGHSHKPHNEVIDGVLFFNRVLRPQKGFEPRYSLGLLHLDRDIRGEIIYFD